MPHHELIDRANYGFAATQVDAAEHAPNTTFCIELGPALIGSNIHQAGCLASPFVRND